MANCWREVSQWCWSLCAVCHSSVSGQSPSRPASMHRDCTPQQAGYEDSGVCGGGKIVLLSVNFIPLTLLRSVSQGERESPSYRRTTGPTHRRHVRTIQEVRTTITRIITDVYYEDGKEVERKVSEVRNRFFIPLWLEEFFNIKTVEWASSSSLRDVSVQLHFDSFVHLVHIEDWLNIS